ncbi:MAG: MerC domain-containing protein [Sphingomonas sp.]|uniref:MerC domain-containing protein n=1 Tax=Sphingomonas sp. TaxID=28214 RepID=UPI003F81827A
MTTKYADWVERAALSASTLCLIHCLALPFVLAALPVLSSVGTLPVDLHVAILVFAIPSSLIALVIGQRGHLHAAPLLVGIAGLTLLALGALVFGAGALETPLTVAGSLTLAGAHVANWRLRHAGHEHDSA